MATYYGYAERDVQNQIDWSKVGKDVSDMLATEVQLREEKKAAIEKATQEYGEELSNQPVGQDAEANKILAEFADSAQELRLMQDRLLRSGSIKLKDYNMMRQNTTSGTGNMFDFADEYNERFELFKKRLDGLGPTGKKSSEIEAWRVEKLGTFATFRNTKPTFNPATGELSLSEMVDDGSGQMVPKEGLSFSSLRNMLYEQTDQFEVLPAAQKISDSFAKTFKIVDPDGKLLTIDDIRNLPDYENTLNAFVKAELEGNPNAAASILVDYLRYSMDDIDMQWNEQQQTYVPNLTAKQEEEAANALKQAVEATFQRVETPKPVPLKSTYRPNATAKAKKNTQRNNLNLLMDVFQGTQAERENALLSLGQGKWENFRFEDENGVVKVFGAKSGKSEQLIGAMDPSSDQGMIDWIEGAGKTLTNDENLLNVIDDSNYDDTVKYDFSPEPNWDQGFQIDVGKAKLERENKTAESWYRNTLLYEVAPNEIDGVSIGSMEDNDIKKIADHFNNQSTTPVGFSMNAKTFGSEDNLELVQDGIVIRTWDLNDPNPNLAKQIREKIWTATKSNSGWRDALLEDAKEAVPNLFNEQQIGGGTSTGGNVRE